VDYSTGELIKRTIAELRNFNTVPLTKRPMLEARTARLSYSQAGVETTLNDISEKTIEAVRYPPSGVYGYIQSRVDVSRNTAYEILKQSGRYDELEINPQLFLDNMIGAIRRTLNSLLVEGMKYE
jgi:type III restriction enzyme